MTFLSLSWRSLNPLKGSLNHHKKVTKNCQVVVFLGGNPPKKNRVKPPDDTPLTTMICNLEPSPPKIPVKASDMIQLFPKTKKKWPPGFSSYHALFNKLLGIRPFYSTENTLTCTFQKAIIEGFKPSATH